MLTDIHHHVVYGLDDGAADYETACAMLKTASEQGVTGVICTTHALPGREAFPFERYRERLSRIQTWCASELPALRLAQGCEILWDSSVPRLLTEGAIPTLNDTNYVLVEFIPSVSWDEMKRAALSIGVAGFRPVFAHVERYACLRQIERLRELEEEYGILAQMNASTVLESKKRGLLVNHWPERVLKLGMIDVVASDAHDLNHRKCRLADAYRFLQEQYDRSMAELLCRDIPECIWEGKPV